MNSEQNYHPGTNGINETSETIVNQPTDPEFKIDKKNPLRRNIGIDLGTANFLVHVEGKGIILNEPTLIAIDEKEDRVLAVGKEAQKMMGRVPANIRIERPLEDGVVSRFDLASKIIQYCLHQACGHTIFRPRVMICVPSGATEIDEKTVIDAAHEAGAGKVYLIEEPVAAAIGAGIDISAPTGHMIIDIGGGTTDIAVISLGGVVVSESLRFAGDKMNNAIKLYIKNKYNLTIGEQSAELIKIHIGALFPHKQVRSVEVRGRNNLTGLPESITLSSPEMLEALTEPVTSILDAVCSVIERTPPELLGDILRNGIIMTGGGSQIAGFDKLISKITNIPVTLANAPGTCVVRGTGIALKNYKNLPEGALNLALARRERL